MTTSNYPSILARIFGKRNHSHGEQTLSWRGRHWVRVGAVWIAISHLGA